MELRQQLEKWREQVAVSGKDAVADMDVAKRLLKHGIEALAEIERLREALKIASAAVEDLDRVRKLRSGDAREIEKFMTLCRQLYEAEQTKNQQDWTAVIRALEKVGADSTALKGSNA